MMTTSTIFNFYDKYAVELRGEGESADMLRQTYNHFVSTDPGRNIDLTCEISRTEPDPETVLGAPNKYYGREGDWFVIRQPEGYGFMSIDADWEHMLMSPDIIHYFVAYLIEFEVRKRLATEGRALIHASGVRIDDTTRLFPAWRHAGKTNVLITLLRAGGDYLADDRVWVGTDGTVRGYPLPIHMTAPNAASFSDLSSQTRVQRLRSQLSERIYDHVDMDRSLLDKVLYFVTSYYIDYDPGRQLVPLGRLVPSAGYVEEAEIDSVVELRAGLKLPNNSIAVEKAPGEDVVTALMSINEYEWNGRLREYYTAHDTLFPDGDKSGELESLIADERRIFSELLENVTTSQALIPRERDWSGTGIDDDVIRLFGGSRPLTESQ